ncbi:MAG: twin-arginine translocation signal domain-containing protein, partial [Candidatus Hydrogenedentes bacterium]|nr:twin-arginine translocation signal domain-containing protein [Candidatus Hydrogenedentota bacterium]
MIRRDFLKRTAAAALMAGPARAAVEPPVMKVLLWCWDARMTWDDEPDKIAHKMAAAERPFPYLKRPESFAAGFRRLIDYCAKMGIHGVIVWGFLRDAHGGIGAAKDLCKYAADRGVAILPGVGLCSYGGYYFDGDHRFNLATYLRKHPERASTAYESGGKRQVTPVLDPSLPANQRWWRDGLEWMLEHFAIGGIDYEMGDFIVNPSPEASRARTALGFEADENIQDIVVATRELMQYAAKQRPYGLFINSTYRGYQQIRGFPRMDYTKALPKQAIWEYTLLGMVRRLDFPQGFEGAPAHRKYGYLHWFNASTQTTQTDYVHEVARVFPGLHQLGFEFTGTYGEISARDNPLADRNYRAQVAWARDPLFKLSDF